MAAWTLLGFANPTGIATTIPVTLTRAQDPGTILVVAAGVNAAGTAFSAADNHAGGPNVYQSDAQATATARASGLLSCKPVNLLANGDIVTVTCASGNGRVAMVYQVAGLDQTSWFVQSTFATGTTTTLPDSGTTSLAAGAYELVGVCAFMDAGVNYTPGSDNQGGTFALLDERNSPGLSHLAVERTTVRPASTLAFKAAGTLAVAASWSQIAAAYKLAGTATAFQPFAFQTFDGFQQTYPADPPGVASGEALGKPGLLPVLCAIGVSAVNGLGLPKLGLTLRMIGATSAEAVGQPLVYKIFVGIVVAMNGIASGEALGIPKLAVTLRGMAVSSAEALGLPRLALTLRAVSALTASAVGTPALLTNLRMIGVTSGEALGLVKLSLALKATEAASAMAAGVPRLFVTLNPSGSSSASALGAPTLAVTFRAVGYSGGAMGTPTLKLTARVIGVVSGEAFGRPLVFVNLAGAPGVPGGVYLSDLQTFMVSASDLARFGLRLADVPMSAVSLADLARFGLRVEDVESGG